MLESRLLLGHPSAGWGGVEGTDNRWDNGSGLLTLCGNSWGLISSHDQTVNEIMSTLLGLKGKLFETCSLLNIETYVYYLRCDGCDH